VVVGDLARETGAGFDFLGVSIGVSSSDKGTSHSSRFGFVFIVGFFTGSAVTLFTFLCVVEVGDAGVVPLEVAFALVMDRFDV
jgi:hypothetical protein